MIRKFQNIKSLCALILACILLTLAVTVYFQKQKPDGPDTLVWDVSGYYMYLPAIFIYHDLKNLSFEKSIVEKYHPSGESYQGGFSGDTHGPKALQYTCGMAIMYSPFFFIANLIAPFTVYPADGFSFPYQCAIGFGSLLISCLGLFFLRKILLQFFSDGVTAITLFAIAVGTNYYEYASISAGLTHTYLFTLYSILIYCSLKFWKRPSLRSAFITGIFVGLITLIRPTEIICFIIPILIGIKSFIELIERFRFLMKKFSLLITAIVPALLFGGLQLLYWKYLTGHFFHYSYGDQQFDWLHPHIEEGLYSFRAGWLVFTPIMIFSIIGFYFLFLHHKQFFWFSILFSVLFIYLCFAWNIWYYSASFGIRAMIQSYAVLAFPFAAFTEWMMKRKATLIFFSSIMLFFSYYNLWLTHQAHKGGLLSSFGMTKEYFWKIFLRYEVPYDTRYFLDCSERFDKTPENLKVIYENDFENDSLPSNENLPVINGNHSLFIDKENSNFSDVKIAFNNAENHQWIRALFICRLKWTEWVDWNMTHCFIKLFSHGKEVKSNFVRMQHVMQENETKKIHLDMKIPDEKFDTLQLEFYKGNSWAPVVIDDLKIEVFNEEK